MAVGSGEFRAVARSSQWAGSVLEVAVLVETLNQVAALPWYFDNPCTELQNGVMSVERRYAFR